MQKIIDIIKTIFIVMLLTAMIIGSFYLSYVLILSGVVILGSLLVYNIIKRDSIPTEERDWMDKYRY